MADTLLTNAKQLWDINLTGENHATAYSTATGWHYTILKEETPLNFFGYVKSPFCEGGEYGYFTAEDIMTCASPFGILSTKQKYDKKTRKDMKSYQPLAVA